LAKQKSTTKLNKTNATQVVTGEKESDLGGCYLTLFVRANALKSENNFQIIQIPSCIQSFRHYRSF